MVALSYLLDSDGRQLVVKNGYLPERNIKTSAGELTIKAPRVRRKQGADSVPEFSSSILPKYLRNSKEIDQLIPFINLKGISTNDFSEVLSKLPRTEVSMSASNVVRLKQVWNDEYNSWKEKDFKI
jgi:putative transposase